MTPAPRQAAAAIREDGYVFLPAATARAFFDAAGQALSGPAWQDFVASWDDLRPDTYMADGGRYRLRRHATYAAAPGGEIQRGPHRPHYQTVGHNPLNGGLERWFEPALPQVGEGAAMMSLLSGTRDVFEASAAEAPAWHVEAHQFRIEARPDVAGKPTPEGMHRDGVAFVLVTLIGRENVAGGVTAIRVDGREGEASFTLEHPLDTVLLDDSRVWHGVTPISPLDPALPGHRDVLVLTFARA
jgi:hypothetical protein